MKMKNNARYFKIKFIKIQITFVKQRYRRCFDTNKNPTAVDMSVTGRHSGRIFGLKSASGLFTICPHESLKD
jgi:hypothetical protein